jgi:dihydroorotate dehydrogenase
LSNPIGISAGLDKSAEIPDALFALGPAIVEVGGVTPFPQDGNPRPRVFRLPREKALINRYGLNSDGAESMAVRLRERVLFFAYKRFGIKREAEHFVLNGGAGVPPGSLEDGKMLIVQVAKNKWTKDDDIAAVTNDFVTATNEVARYSDIISVNVSSPNTPGLRTLQRVEPLTRILEGVVDAAKSVNRKLPPKVMVKVSPDEDTDEQIQGIVEAVWRSGVDGIIVGNTTKRRSDLVAADMTSREKQTLDEVGGYSGPKMYERTLNLVKRYRNLLDQPTSPSKETEVAKLAGGAPAGDEHGSNTTEKILSTRNGSTEPDRKPKVIFATGGVTNGKQALELLNAGASVVQVYTAVIYSGVGTITRIKKEMRDEILGN